MGEEDADALKLPRGGLSYTVGQSQPLAPVTSSAPPSEYRATFKPTCCAVVRIRWHLKGREFRITTVERKKISRERGSHPGDGVGTRSLQLGMSSGRSSGLAPLLPPPMSSSPRSGGDPGKFYSCIPSDASSNQEQAFAADEETDCSKRLRKAAPLPSRSTLEIDSRDRGLPSGMETSKSHIIEILAGDMKAELQSQLKKSEVQEKMICKIPEITRSLDKVAYAPQFVSFGPYHRGTKALNSADKYKWLCLEQILNMNKEVTLEKYLEEMDGMTQDVKDCYEEDPQIMETHDNRIKMLLLDGCCILGFLGILPLFQQQVEDKIQRQDEVEAEASWVWKFKSVANKMLACIIRKSPSGDSIMGEDVVAEASTLEKSRSTGSIQELLLEFEKLVQVLAGLASQVESESTADSAIITHWHLDVLFVMENQLPFFVLKKIYDLDTAGTTTAGTAVAEPPTLENKVDRAIKKLLPCFPLVTAKLSFHQQSFHHLLHFCYLMFKPAKANSSSSDSKPTANSSSSYRKPTDELEPWRGAMDLYKAGIKFKRKKCNDSESLLDVEFSERTLMIPTLIIQDSASSVFRNLITFEEYCSRENYFAAYAFFMGELMRTPGDVTFLVKKGVVENYMGADKDVSDFFNNLVKGVVFDVNGKHFLSSTFKELKSSYNSVGNKHIADLKQNHCRSPWLVIPVVVGFIVLVCTVVQTVFDRCDKVRKTLAKRTV